MPCDFKSMPGAILCSRGRGRGIHPRCQVDGCQQRSDYQCDYPLRDAQTGKRCDRFLCRAHAIDQGRGVQFCPTHATAEQLSLPEPGRKEEA